MTQNGSLRSDNDNRVMTEFETTKQIAMMLALELNKLLDEIAYMQESRRLKLRRLIKKAFDFIQ